jgi:hypothetical protein
MRGFVRLGRASLKIGVRVASAGVLTGDEIVEGVKIGAEAAKVVGDETAKAVDDLLKERLDSHGADRKAIEEFRKSLSDLAGQLSGSPQQSEAGGNPRRLIFVIDELDRCRPSFALELLEKTKHFFSVPGVIFLLVSSLEQLETAVRFAYGDIDARTYLEKFYHLRLLFPTGRNNRLDLAGATY